VYFDHDLPRLLSLVDRAAALGAERFVLDDGWFTGRRDATGALGDWTVDDTTWPEGLHPLVDAVRAGGMQFGLWVEPEALSPRSALAAEHPEWMLAPSEDVGPTARNQHVLNLADAGAFAHILDLLDRLIGEYRVDYLKWDHNRDLLEAVDRGTGRARVHDQTHATYALMDELHRRHPHLEIESCAGGGGRVDLGVAEHVDRFWASDCNDPVERTEIERWTALLVPPELIGTHVGAPRSHTTGRVSDLSFRLATTMFGHAGIEWDLATVDDEDLAVLAEWAALYKRMRSLIAGGTVVNADLADDGTLLRGVISPDADAGLFLWARLRSSIAGQPGRVRIPGLDPGAHYTVAVIDSLGPVRRATAHDPEWMDEPGFTCAGRVLATAGLPLPGLAVESGMLLELRRADR
jgi:alpha-galactosidase